MYGAYSDLIRPTRFRKVAHPLDAVIVTLLEHLQEPHNKAGGSEHEHLEINIDGRSGPHLAMCGACQLSRAREGCFCAPLYPRNPGRMISNHLQQEIQEMNTLPHDNVLRRNILRFTVCHLTVDACRVQRGRYSHHDVCGRQFVTEICLDGDDVGDLRRPDLVDSWYYA